MGTSALPSVDSLLCFVAGAEQLSFRKAARSVALTPAAFSHRIKQLEQQLECQLFERSPQRVLLTPQGQVLLERARVAIDALHGCRDLAGSGDAPLQMTVGTRFELGLSWVMPFLIELHHQRPNWRVDLIFGSGAEILERLSSGQLDGIITSAAVANSDWHAEVLHPEHYVFVGQRAMLQAQPLQTLDDTRRHRLVDINNDLPLASYLLRICPGLVFRDVQQAGTAAAVLQVVQAGQGVAVLPRYMLTAALERDEIAVLFPERPLPTDSFRLIFHRRSPLAGSMRELANMLRERPLG